MKKKNDFLSRFVSELIKYVPKEIEFFEKIISFCESVGIATFETMDRPEKVQNIFPLKESYNEGISKSGSKESVTKICQWLEKTPPICVVSKAIYFNLSDDTDSSEIVGYELYVFHQQQIFCIDFGLAEDIRIFSCYDESQTENHNLESYEEEEEENLLTYEELAKIEEEGIDSINFVVEQTIKTGEVSLANSDSKIAKVAKRFYVGETKERMDLYHNNSHYSCDFIFEEDMPYRIKSSLTEQREKELFEVIKLEPRVMFAKNSEQRIFLGQELLANEDLTGIGDYNIDKIMKKAKDSYEIITIPSVVVEKWNVLDEKGKHPSYTSIAKSCGISTAKVKKILGRMGELKPK